MLETALLVASGLLAGTLGGLLGLGGGVVLMQSAPVHHGTVARTRSGNLPIGRVFCHSWWKLPSLSSGPHSNPVLGTFVGANFGATLNKRFSSGRIRLLFGVVFSYVSIQFILSFLEAQT